MMNGPPSWHRVHEPGHAWRAAGCFQTVHTATMVPAGIMRWHEMAGSILLSLHLTAWYPPVKPSAANSATTAMKPSSWEWCSTALGASASAQHMLNSSELLRARRCSMAASGYAAAAAAAGSSAAESCCCCGGYATCWTVRKLRTYRVGSVARPWAVSASQGREEGEKLQAGGRVGV
jgi:hypothetical protein